LGNRNLQDKLMKRIVLLLLTLMLASPTIGCTREVKEPSREELYSGKVEFKSMDNPSGGRDDEGFGGE